DYDRYTKGCSYSIPFEKLKRGWQEAKYLALYVKSGVCKENGVLVYGKIKEVKSARIAEMDFLNFEVEYWINLNPIIKPIHYGISSYILTSLNTIKEAKELPELFMKSKEEMVIWRMLRRISDRIKLDLDETDLDKASRVVEYNIKDIRIHMNKAERKIVFTRNGVIEDVPIEDLEKNPTGVFRVLMGIFSK
ncbi:restriction endonuclease, partial [Bacillus xiapuensis]|nr:restriction endonuclease [Bacillus xiapuensis]